MKKILSAVIAVGLLGSAGTAANAEPGGCIKYGAAGAVGGHVVHHGVLGAVGGCATGMYVRHKYRKEARQKAALYDQDHPGAKGSYAQKATAYDVEHSTQPGSTQTAASPTSPTSPTSPSTTPNAGSPSNN